MQLAAASQSQRTIQSMNIHSSPVIVGGTVPPLAKRPPDERLTDDCGGKTRENGWNAGPTDRQAWLAWAPRINFPCKFYTILFRNKAESSAIKRKANKKVQQSWQTSALAMHLPLARLVSNACHILPASKFQYSYSCILLIFYRHQWTACMRTVREWVNRPLVWHFLFL